MLRFILILAAIAAALRLASYIAGGFYYHFDDKSNEGLKRANMEEKQFRMPDGSILNYAESPPNGQPKLLLLHGQMGSWEDYAYVLEKLSQDFHIYALDYYGHGGSSKRCEKYNINAIGTDIVFFMQSTIRERCVVSGYSTGGALAAWIASNAPESVLGFIAEDAPFFASAKDRIENTYGWQDGFSTIHEFFQQSEEKSYTRWWLTFNFVRVFWKQYYESLVRYPFEAEMKANPGKIPRIREIPGAYMNKIVSTTANIQDGTGNYDLRFGDTFYDSAWYEGYNETESLRKINCPSLLIHVDSHYDDKGVLVGACDNDDAEKAHQLIEGSELLIVKSFGHDIHNTMPKRFVKILIGYKDKHLKARQSQLSLKANGKSAS